MKPPAWLAEFHRQWMKARAGSVKTATRPFSRPWESLLDEAGLHTHDEREAARREAERLPLRLIPPRGKHRIVDKIELPLTSEPWLHAQFGSTSGRERQGRSLEVLQRWKAQAHPLLPDLWDALLQKMETAFAAGKGVGPFSWQEPERVEELLALLFALTARTWRAGTLIRDASTALGRDSKCLEAQEKPLTRALQELFGEETPLEALGIQTRNSVLHFSGPLELVFEDGTRHQTDLLRFESTFPVAEIERAVRLETTAARLLTVENSKTTFLQLARADRARSTLLVATSFPTQAVRRLLEKLPPDLPHHHFGDTDPSGWDILRRLRGVCPRPVEPFQMGWRDAPDSPPLTWRDRQILARLLADPAMADCHADLAAMLEAGRKGGYEQESLGPPKLGGWPFFP